MQDKTIPVMMPAQEVQEKFSEIVNRVNQGIEHFIIEQDGSAMVAIISIEEYEKLYQQELEKVEKLKRFRQLTAEIQQEIKAQAIDEVDSLAELKSNRTEFNQKYYGIDE